MRHKWVPGIFLDVKSGRSARKVESRLHLWTYYVENLEPIRLTTPWASMIGYRDLLAVLFFYYPTIRRYTPKLQFSSASK
jgi:hypothetical protein